MWGAETAPRTSPSFVAPRRSRGAPLLSFITLRSHGGGRARDGQLDGEAAAARLVVLEADGAAVLGGDLADDRQAETHAGHLGREVRQEELVAVLLRDARAVVAHDDAHVGGAGQV